jgi:hypothetical protein
MAPRTPDVQDPARDDDLSPADSAPEATDGVTGIPDGPGPRDVPDDKVIERTLPSTPGKRDDSPSS